MSSYHSLGTALPELFPDPSKKLCPKLWENIGQTVDKLWPNCDLTVADPPPLQTVVGTVLGYVRKLC